MILSISLTKKMLLIIAQVEILQAFNYGLNKKIELLATLNWIKRYWIKGQKTEIKTCLISVFCIEE